MKRYVCLFACLLLMVMSIPVFAVPEDETQPDDGYTHLDVMMDCVVDTTAQMLVVGLKDQNGGAVNGYVYIEVDGEQFGDGVNATDHDNRVSGAVAKISYASVPSTAVSVQVVSSSYTWDTTWFEEARRDVTAEVFASLGYETNTTPTTTQTTQVQQADATVSSEETTPTTGVSQSNREQLAIDVDASLAEHFGYSEAELESRIKAYVNAEEYAYYVGDSGATLHLLITYDETCSDNQSSFIDAKNADTHYASYADEDVKGMAFKIDLVFTSENGETEFLDVNELKYDMEMVIPASMQKSKELTFAIIEENGQLAGLKAAYPSNGAIVLTLSTFQSFAVMSFGTQTEKVVENPSVWEATLNVFNTWQTALAFIAGVLLLVGGIVLIVVSAKKRADMADASEEYPPKEDEVLLLDEEVCKAPVPSRKAIPAEETVKAPQKRPLDEAIPVIHHVENKEAMDPEAFGRLSEQSVTPAKITPRNVTPSGNENVQKAQSVLSVDDLLDELSEDLENLKKQ